MYSSRFLCFAPIVVRSNYPIWKIVVCVFICCPAIKTISKEKCQCAAVTWGIVRQWGDREKSDVPQTDVSLSEYSQVTTHTHILCTHVRSLSHVCVYLFVCVSPKGTRHSGSASVWTVRVSSRCGRGRVCATVACAMAVWNLSTETNRRERASTTASTRLSLTKCQRY